MRLSGVALACLLLLGPAARAGGTEQRVRALIESYRSEDGRKEWELVFAPAPSCAVERMTCEYWWDEGHQVRRGYVRFVPGNDAVAVLGLTLCTVPADGPFWTPDGCTVRKAAMSWAAYRDFLEATRLVARARLRKRSDRAVPAPPQSNGRFHVGNVRIRIGDIWEGKGDLTPEVWVEQGLIGSSIEEHAKAHLCDRVLVGAMETLDFESMDALPTGFVTGLRNELSAVDGWRRDLRAAFLGWLGGVEELKALRAIQPATPVTARAILQIEVLTDASKSEAGLARLLGLADDADPGLQAWARVVLRKGFKDAYKDKLAKDYRAAAEWKARGEALKEYRAVDPADVRLYREALKDPVAWIRAVAAGRLQIADTLLQLAKDKSLRRHGDFRGRLLAIGYLEDLPAAKQGEAGEVLLSILRDEADDVRARKDAAEVIGILGHRAAIPQLLATLKEPVPLIPVSLEEGEALDQMSYLLCHDVRIGVARALGLLRAEKSTGTLMDLLAQGVEERHLWEGSLAAEAGESLARIGHAAAQPLLEQACERVDAEKREYWDRRVRLLKAIHTRDGRGILAASDRGRVLLTASGTYGPCDRFWIELLAHVVALEELMTMAPEYGKAGDAWADKVVRAAIRKKTGRE